MPTTLLGLDVGTQSVKGLLVQPGTGTIVARASAALETLEGLPPGYSEQRPEDWIDAIRRVCANLGEQAPDAYARIAAIGVSGQQHGLVLLDDRDRPLRPALLWNDVRCTAECAALVEELGGEAALFERLGLGSLPPGFTAGKIRWIRDHEPDVWAATRRVLLPHDYVNLWLTGEFATECGDASGTGLLDVRARRFDLEFAGRVADELPDRLPTLLSEARTVLGSLHSNRADELGLPQGIAVAPGGGDNMMAAFGAGALTPGTVVMSLGTSGTVFARADQPVCDPDGEIAPFCDSAGGWLPLGCTQNATVATEAARRQHGMSHEQFERALRDVPAGSDGVLCLPFHTGERSPNLPTARAAFLGLTQQNQTPAHFVRASAEGATYALCRLLDRLGRLGLEPRALRLTGGGSNSPAWCQLVADASGVPVQLGVDADAAALGAALQAEWVSQQAVGGARSAEAVHSEFHAAADSDSTDAPLLQPEPAAVARHRERRLAWNTAVQALTPVFDTLA